MGADRIGPAVHAQGSLTATRSSLSRAVVHSDARPDHQADATIVKDRKTATSSANSNHSDTNSPLHPRPEKPQPCVRLRPGGAPPHTPRQTRPHFATTRVIFDQCSVS